MLVAPNALRCLYVGMGRLYADLYFICSSTDRKLRLAVERPAPSPFILDLKNNVNLTELHYNDNLLTELDVKVFDVRTLFCYHNKIRGTQMDYFIGMFMIVFSTKNK